MIKRFKLDPKNPPKLTAADRARLARLDRMKDSEIDYSDIPEFNDEMFKRARRVVPPRNGR